MFVGIYASVMYICVYNFQYAYMHLLCWPTFSHSIGTSGHMLNGIAQAYH